MRGCLVGELYLFHEASVGSSSSAFAAMLRDNWVVVKIMVLFLGTLNNRCRIIIGTQKGTLILRTTQLLFRTFLQDLEQGRVREPTRRL